MFVSVQSMITVILTTNMTVNINMIIMITVVTMIRGIGDCRCAEAMQMFKLTNAMMSIMVMMKMLLMLASRDLVVPMSHMVQANTAKSFEVL